MSNQEREAFERAFRAAIIECTEPDFEQFGYRYMDTNTLAAYKSFQAGAAYQREQDKGLVEALENCMEFAANTGNQCIYDMLNDTLATFRAAQEGK